MVKLRTRNKSNVQGAMKTSDGFNKNIGSLTNLHNHAQTFSKLITPLPVDSQSSKRLDLLSSRSREVLKIFDTTRQGPEENQYDQRSQEFIMH